MAKAKKLEKIVLTRQNTAKYPWQWASNSVEHAEIVKVLEYVPGKDRPRFMDELYRVLAPGGTAMVKTPYWSSAGGYQDYLYEWPPINDNSFAFFNAKLREQLGATDRGIKCDFEFTGGYEMEAAVAQRAEEARSFALRHYTNAILALQVTLTKRAQ